MVPELRLYLQPLKKTNMVPFHFGGGGGGQGGILYIHILKTSSLNPCTLVLFLLCTYHNIQEILPAFAYVNFTSDLTVKLTFYM